MTCSLGSVTTTTSICTWMLSLWLTTAGIANAQTEARVLLGKPQPMKLPSLDKSETGERIDGEVTRNQGALGPAENPLGEPYTLNSSSATGTSLIIYGQAALASTNQREDEAAKSSQTASPAIGRNSVLPKPLSDSINRRYQAALNALPNNMLSGPTQQPIGGNDNTLNALPPQLLEGIQVRPPAEQVVPLPNQPPTNPAVAQEAQEANTTADRPGLLIPGAPQVPELPAPNDTAQGAISPNFQAPSQTPSEKIPPPLDALKPNGPSWMESPPEAGKRIDWLGNQVPYEPGAFLPSPVNPIPDDPMQAGLIYRGKFPVPVQRPLVELGRPLYTGGIYPPAGTWLGFYNPVMPHFMVYGDFRAGAAVNRNRAGDADDLAFRLNLDMDLEITATERLHAFVGPFDRAGDFTRFDFDKGEFVNRTDLRLDNLFFEGDAGALWGGLTNQDAPFDLPFTLGFLPFFYQNGIWAADNAIGAAFALPWRHSTFLNWSNFDATFFWASDQINTDAFPGDNNAAEFAGTAWFIEAYDGYFEIDYAFVHDDVGGHRSYHNFSAAFSKRYLNRVSNSVRFITNFGQSLPRDQRTADGHLLLIENSLISSSPNTFVPYLNFFYGQGRTQSLARAAVAGGILTNTGINFEIDGLTGYPTLDATGVNSTGAAIGLNMLGQNFSQQLIVEVAALAANGSPQFRNAPGDQYAVGLRYQRPLTNAWLFRTDHMYGFLRNTQDIRGSRFELRWKF